MFDEKYKKWPKNIVDLIYIDNKLTKKDKIYINNTLNVAALRLFVNFRYTTDPQRYDKMKKAELIEELKYSRYS